MLAKSFMDQAHRLDIWPSSSALSCTLDLQHCGLIGQNRFPIEKLSPSRARLIGHKKPSFLAEIVCLLRLKGQKHKAVSLTGGIELCPNFQPKVSSIVQWLWETHQQQKQFSSACVLKQKQTNKKFYPANSSTASVRNRNMAELSYLRANHRDIKGNWSSCMTACVFKKFWQVNLTVHHRSVLGRKVQYPY